MGVAGRRYREQSFRNSRYKARNITSGSRNRKVYVVREMGEKEEGRELGEEELDFIMMPNGPCSENGQLLAPGLCL